MKKYLGLSIIFAVVIILSGCGKTNSITNEVNEAEVNQENTVGSNKVEAKVLGSCVFAAEGACVDYIGPSWTEASIKLQCAGEKLVFSKERCGYSKIGGCRMAKGTGYDLVTWTYKSVKGQADEVTARMMKGTCESTGVGEWIAP